MSPLFTLRQIMFLIAVVGGLLALAVNLRLIDDLSIEGALEAHESVLRQQREHDRARLQGQDP